MTIKSKAYKKFLASAPVPQREFRTIEVYHPKFDKIYRFVKDYENQNLVLESTAPRGAGIAVTFEAIAMDIIEPGEVSGGEQILTVNLGAIGNEVEDAIKNITGEDYLTPIELIYRKYYSGDISEPILVLYLSISSFNFEGYTKVSFTGEDSDLANKSSGEKYTIERFPMLRNIG